MNFTFLKMRSPHSVKRLIKENPCRTNGRKNGTLIQASIQTSRPNGKKRGTSICRADGTPIFLRTLPQGFFIVVEARPGPSGRPVATSTFNWSPSDPNVLPDLQILVSRPLGDGSTAVCDRGQTSDFIGGVPAVDPPSFGGTQFASDAINDLSCRFDARRASADACTRNRFQEERFVDRDSTVQFCTSVGVGVEIAFPPGDTRVTARLRDTLGQPGLPASIIVRIGSGS